MVKDDYVKVRLPREQKELLRRVADQKNMTMSEFVLVATDKAVLKELEKATELKDLEPRVQRLDRTIEVVKARMDERRHISKSSLKFFSK